MKKGGKQKFGGKRAAPFKRGGGRKATSKRNSMGKLRKKKIGY